MAFECRAPLRPPGLCGPHAHHAVLVYLDDIPARVIAARVPAYALRLSEDDRVRVSPRLDAEAFGDPLVEECVESVPTRPQRVDVACHRFKVPTI
jgi:hypothetical protein